MHEEAHANPVGSVLKDIYVIKNDLNNLLYVGQSADVDFRFRQHCRMHHPVRIDMAIAELGREHFWYEILESGVHNPDEREAYWIKKLDTIYPNGYNVKPNCKDVVESIKDDLKNTKLSLNDIATKHNVSKRTVLRINSGISHYDSNEQYPVRKESNLMGMLSDKQAEEIIEILRYTYRQYKDIGAQYGVSVNAIKNINDGATHRRDDVSYPIRAYKNSGEPVFSYEQVTEIIDLLQHSSLSIRQISYLFAPQNLTTIFQINSGAAKRYRRDGVTYPIRPYSKKEEHPCIDYLREGE